VWAFGCVLYEMLTGTRAFEGEDISDTLAAVLRGEPDWTALPPETPALVRTLLRCCLEKDRRRRIGDLSAARFVVEEFSIAGALGQPPSTAATAPVWRRVALGFLLMGIATGAALAAGVIWSGRRTPTPPPVARFSITFDGQIRTPLSRFAAISPDGTKIVYATDRLYIRPLAETTARPIGGTEVANGLISDPTFSPDGSTIVFWVGRDPLTGELKKVAVDGGPVTTIASASFPLGISWGTNGIVYAQIAAFTHGGLIGIVRVSPDGGQSELLVAVKNDEIATDPQVIPGQNTLLFTLASGVPALPPALGVFDKARIVVQSLATGRRTVVIDGGSAGRYVSSGHLLYAVGGTLVAVPFDARTQRATGPAMQVLERVRRPGREDAVTGTALFGVSDTGSLLYVAGELRSSRNTTVLALMTDKGDVQPLNQPPAPYFAPRVSPDGKRIAYHTDDGNEATVWIYDLSGATSPKRLTFGGRNRFPIWSPDSQWIAFESNQERDEGIFRQRADGNGTPERLTRATPGHFQIPETWSKQPTGDVVLFGDFGPPRETLQTLTMADKKIAPWGGIDAPPGAPLHASFSPDGHWVAYSIVDESGPFVYVQPFPATGPRFQIAEHAITPMWSPTGHELFYLSNVDQGLRPSLSRVKVATTPDVPLPPPTSFELKRVPGDLIGSHYDVLRDGRFVYRASASDGPANPPIQLVLNWFTELRQRVPVK
jgi:serine/threonine-protein kinase